MSYNPQIKPLMWGPHSQVEFAVRDYYENILGVPPPVAYFPFWERAGNIIHNYGVGYFNPSYTSALHTWAGDYVTYPNATQGILTNKALRVVANADFTVLATGISAYYAGGSVSAYLFGQSNTGYSITARVVDWSSTWRWGSVSNYVVAGDIEHTPGTGPRNYAYCRRNGATNKDYFLYHQGEQVGTQVNKAAGQLYFSDASSPLGIATVNTSADYTGTIGALTFFDNVGFTLEQAQRAHYEPYAAIQPRSFPRYFFLSVGDTPPTTYFIPKTMTHKFIPPFIGGN